ncbi:TonB-dependent receptor [Pontibacter sp. Tf4]|uniref:TonB-dependent receptor n=1 Tax=Pontibacter sp. Tf4 TaxID=2761620 RepID=UPI0016255562|nr:TonB-dependent receptor [Pontibacter sp. Tf4]MBB6611606.1 TonB-dependent receptor [Pontibacter sp. Tf4]
MLQRLLLVLLLFLSQQAIAQESGARQYRLSGTVKGAWGEKLEGAYLVFSSGKTALSDKQGRFSVMLPAGKHEVTCQFIGMTPFRETVVLNSDKEVVFTLIHRNFDLQVVEITGRQVTDPSSTNMGSTFIDQKLMTRMPKLLGEADVIRTVSALPGVVNAGEGTSGFFVRGGSADQNLVLMDDAPLFNANHLFGFFSVYNPDILKSFMLHRSGISARYGSRISSILDVSLRDGNPDKMQYEIGVSPITGKLSMDGPLSEKATMLVAVRGAYPNYIMKLFPSRNIKQSSGHFYDANLKLKYKLNENNNLSFSGYYSNDGFKFPNDTTYQWSNALGTVKWSHLFNNDFSGVATLVKSVYKNKVEGLSTGEEFELHSGVDLTQAKLDFGYFGLKGHQVDFGGEASLYAIEPGDLRPSGTSSLNPRTMQQDRGIEKTLYVNDEITFSEKLSISLGLRYSHFAKIGPAVSYVYAEGQPRSEQTITDTIHYSSGSVVKTYHGLEPRASVKYSLTPASSVKVGYSRTRQYIQLISNTAAITPVDVWKLSNQYIKPQVADQLSVGYFYADTESMYEFNWEVYYKKLYNQVDYKDGATLLLNPSLESDLLIGDGYAYGSEWMVKKNIGRLKGWVSLTYSRSMRQIEGATAAETINNGDPYPSNYDKPVNVNVFADYHLWPDWKFTANFTYTTGRPVTLADSWYWYQGQIFANYSGRNQERMPDYHRLDVSLNREPIKKENVEYSYGISVYNLYGRKNAYSMLYQHYYGEPPSAYKLSVIGAPIPSINFNIKF